MCSCSRSGLYSGRGSSQIISEVTSAITSLDHCNQTSIQAHWIQAHRRFPKESELHILERLSVLDNQCLVDDGKTLKNKTLDLVQNPGSAFLCEWQSPRPCLTVLYALTEFFLHIFYFLRPVVQLTHCKDQLVECGMVSRILIMMEHIHGSNIYILITIRSFYKYARNMYPQESVYFAAFPYPYPYPYPFQDPYPIPYAIGRNLHGRS